MAPLPLLWVRAARCKRCREACERNLASGGSSPATPIASFNRRAKATVPPRVSKVKFGHALQHPGLLGTDLAIGRTASVPI